MPNGREIRGHHDRWLPTNSNQFGEHIARRAEQYFDLKADNYARLERFPSHKSFHATSIGHIWDALLKRECQAGDRVKAGGVVLCEWLPLSPGRYYTRDAMRAREMAGHWYDEQVQEFRPSGKASMLSGGIGSLRVRALPAVAQTHALLNAVSTEYSHTGMPVRLPLQLFNRVVDEIRRFGSVKADISGTVSTISVRDTPFEHDPRVPAAVIEVDELSKVRATERDKRVSATVAITFAPLQAIDARNLERDALFRPQGGRKYSYASFPINGRDDGLVDACRWLEDYVIRQSDGIPNAIVCDFDDTQIWFDTEIKLPLSSVKAGLYSLRQLSREAKSVFMSYRTADLGGRISADVGRVFDFLKYQSGIDKVFWDKRSLRAGEGWEPALRDNIAASSAVLAFIGPNWERQRQADGIDYVIRELQWATEFRKPILPIMIEGRQIGSVNFPPDLEHIRGVQHCLLDHANFDRTTAQLSNFLAAIR